MAKTYVTFGQVHSHSVNEQTFDRNCVAVINCSDPYDGRSKAHEYFGVKFCFTYFEDEWNEEDQLKYFPRGYMEVNPDG